jgi:hypothetical protein
MLAESIPRNRFLGSLKIYKYGLWLKKLKKLKKQNSNVYGYSLLESLRKKDVLNIEGGGVGVTQGEGGRGGLRWRSANRRGGN